MKDNTDIIGAADGGIFNCRYDKFFTLINADNNLFKFTYYSPNFKKKFGYEIPVQGFPDSMFNTDIIYEEDKPVLREHFQSLLKGQTDME